MKKKISIFIFSLLIFSIVYGAYQCVDKIIVTKTNIKRLFQLLV